MIDAALRTMIDDVLPSPSKLPRSAVEQHRDYVKDNQ